MAYEHRELTGSLFENNDRSETNNQPDFRGKALLGGVLYNVSSWKQTSRSGIDYQSLKFTPAADKPDFGGAVKDRPVDNRSSAEIIDDDIPF
jgi:uncharacterized protein (DUF736 family)